MFLRYLSYLVQIAILLNVAAFANNLVGFSEVAVPTIYEKKKSDSDHPNFFLSIAEFETNEEEDSDSSKSNNLHNSIFSIQRFLSKPLIDLSCTTIVFVQKESLYILYSSLKIPSSFA